ncbi:MAG: hypothetical protein L0K89_06630, partial [Bifidobacterium crudilactis]|nr:hypothetical protein [Bifidobacterium crudilactis]
RAHQAQSQEAKAEIDASTAAGQARNEAGHVGPVTSDSRQSDSLTSDSSGRDARSHRHARDDFDDAARHGNHDDTVKQD